MRGLKQTDNLNPLQQAERFWPLRELVERFRQFPELAERFWPLRELAESFWSVHESPCEFAAAICIAS